MNKAHLHIRDRVSRFAPFFLIALFALPALWLLLQDKAFCTHDGSLHFYRLVALRHAIDQGLVFSRWTPGLVYGYGFPFFNFREIGSYYLPEALYLLGLSVPAALNLVYAGGLLLSGWGTYLLARDIWRKELAGLVAAVAYIYAPYQLLNIYVRGNLPESMALALLPWIIWLFRRLVDTPRVSTLIPAILSVAALFLTHHISSLLFIPMLVIYLAVLFLLRRRQQTGGWLLVLAALLIGIALTTFAWLPAIAEKESVQLYLTHSSRGNDFHFNFLTLAELFAPPTPADPTLLNPPLRVNLGLPQLILGVIGLLRLLFSRRPESANDDRCRLADREGRWHGAIFALATTLLLLLSLPISTPWWETLPLIRFVQFPWRLVGRAALPLALLAGAVPTLAPRRPVLSFLSTALAVTILILAAFPWLFGVTCSFPPSPTIANVIDFERATGQTGVDPLGAYLPRWVIQRPTHSPMEAALRSGATPRRFDSASIPPGGILLLESYGPNRATIRLETPTAFQAVYHTFFFPGWAVRVDGERVPIKPVAQTGLISFSVPPGQHTITIRWGPTPLRIGAAAVSITGLVALALVSKSITGKQKTAGFANPGARQSRYLLILLALALLAFKFELVDPGHTPLRSNRLTDGVLPGLEHPASTSLADGLELLGYQVSAAPAGSEFRIDLAWTARQPPVGDYATRVALVDADGQIWSAKETFRPRGYQPHPPTAEWRPDAWVWDSHAVPILPGTPPGAYQLKLTVFDRKTLTPLNVLDAAGCIAGPDLVIGELFVERPKTLLTGLEMQHTIKQQWNDLTLLGANLDRSEAAPGNPALITLFWQAQAPLPLLTAQLELLDPRGEAIQEWQLALIREEYPPNSWRVNDELMSQHLLQIPGRAEDGMHTWQLTVLDAAGAPLAPSISLGSLLISAPERLWKLPAVTHPVDVPFSLASGIIFSRLSGYTLEQAGNQLDLTLVWQAEAETEISYRVFVHLLAPDGSIAVQSDGIPAAWARPTPGWAPGEFIIDAHTLTIPDDLPAGEYALAAGIYDLVTGNRLDATQDTLNKLTLP